jgi:hypothetical protein
MLQRGRILHCILARLTQNAPTRPALWFMAVALLSACDPSGVMTSQPAGMSLAAPLLTSEGRVEQERRNLSPRLTDLNTCYIIREESAITGGRQVIDTVTIGSPQRASGDSARP